jgi:hypothetical protein
MLVVQGIAVLAAALFAGAALYVSLVEHPARLACGDEVAARQFAKSYPRAAVMQVSLALGAATAGGVVGLRGGGPAWWLGALLMVAVLPYTFAAMARINRALLAPDLERGARDAGRLLRRWGRLHAVRAALGLAGTGVYLGAALA